MPTACASASNSIGSALRAIQYGDADVMLTGGSEAALTPMGLAGFQNMRALSFRSEAPQQASRPFDVDRDGFVLAEGAGVPGVRDHRDGFRGWPPHGGPSRRSSFRRHQVTSPNAPVFIAEFLVEPDEVHPWAWLARPIAGPAGSFNALGKRSNAPMALRCNGSKTFTQCVGTSTPLLKKQIHDRGRRHQGDRGRDGS